MKPDLEEIVYFGPLGKQYGILYWPGPGPPVFIRLILVDVPIFHFGMVLTLMIGAYCPGPGV